MKRWQAAFFIGLVVGFNPPESASILYSMLMAVGFGLIYHCLEKFLK